MLPGVRFEQVYEYESGNDLKLEVKKSRKLQHMTSEEIENVSKVLLREILYNLYNSGILYGVGHSF